VRRQNSKNGGGLVFFSVSLVHEVYKSRQIFTVRNVIMPAFYDQWVEISLIQMIKLVLMCLCIWGLGQKRSVLMMMIQGESECVCVCVCVCVCDRSAENAEIVWSIWLNTHKQLIPHQPQHWTLSQSLRTGNHRLLFAPGKIYPHLLFWQAWVNNKWIIQN